MRTCTTYFIKYNQVPSVFIITSYQRGSVSRNNENKYENHPYAIIASKSANLSKLYRLRSPCACL